MVASAFTISQLLYPELLSTNELKTILKDRCIQLKKMDSLSREELLAVVHRVAVPLPQRSRPGITPDVVPQLQGSASYSLGSSQSKKPESCINFERKTIKLKKSLDSTTTSRESAETTNGIRPQKMVKVAPKRTEPSTEKHSTDKQDETPVKKARTKITWP